MLYVDRRKFLALLGMSVLFPELALGKTKKQSKREQETVLILVSQNGRATPQLLAISRSGKKWKSFDLPLKNSVYGPHSIEPNPKDPSQLAIFTFQADTMVLFSLREGKVIRTVRAKPGFVFSGHGLFTLDGNHFMASEFKSNESSDGFISIRSFATGEIVDEIVTGGAHPHQMISLDPQQEMLAISHYGKAIGFEKKELNSEVIYLETKSKKITHRVKSPYLNVALCHIVADSRKRGDVFISAHDHLSSRPVADPKLKNAGLSMPGKYFPTPVFFMSQSSTELQKLDDKGNLENLVFNFSIALSEKHNTFGLVHQDAMRVSFWDMEKKQLRKMFHFPGFRPTGLNTNPSGDEFFMAATGMNSKVIFFGAKDLKVVDELVLPMRGVLAGHMAWTSFQV